MEAYQSLHQGYGLVSFWDILHLSFPNNVKKNYWFPGILSNFSANFNFNIVANPHPMIFYYFFVVYFPLFGHDRMVVGFITTYAINAYRY